jgi:DNA-binding NarL/FixJ family response regulator
MTIRILIVDDHSVVREGLRMFLGRDPELKIVDEAANGAEAIEKAHYWRPMGSQQPRLFVVNCRRLR